jgi:hypothetical protein
MSDALIHICHSVTSHSAAMMMAGGAVGCFLHCAGTCALCLSGGSALSVAFFKLCAFIVRRLAPVLLAFAASLPILSRSLTS